MDFRMPDHRTTCENSVRRFYLVKMQEFRNPKLAMAEELLRHRLVFLEARRMKLAEKVRPRFALCRLRCHKEDQKKVTEDLKALQVSLDKITFANKRSLIKAVRQNTSLEEIDNLVRNGTRGVIRSGLHFGMLHGSNNLANERKILKKTQLTRRKTNPLMTLEDYDGRIRELQCSFHSGRRDSAVEKQRITSEILELKLAKEAAVESAVCNGEMWESLGDKDEIQERIKIIQEDIEARRGKHLEMNAKAALVLRKFEAVVKNLARLDKKLSNINKIMGGAYKCFFQWRNEHQQANLCYNQNVSILDDARKLAEEKDVASLRSLCDQQTAMFMEKWNNEGDFREDYKRRASVSLNSRGLCSDGRTRNPDKALNAMGG